MKITTTHRRAAFIVFVAAVAFGSGGLVGSLTAKPEVVTVSKAVPTACTDAIDAGFDGLTAERRVEQYQEKAAALTADLTLATIAADATLLEDALSPIAKQNEREEEWRVNSDEAHATFIAAANQCLALDTAAEAVRDH